MEQSDVLYGRPSEGQVKRMQNAIARIQSVCNWEQQLQILGVQPEGKPDLGIFMTKVLRRAWKRSLAKGYHSKASCFTTIASGFALHGILCYQELCCCLWGNLLKPDCDTR